MIHLWLRAWGSIWFHGRESLISPIPTPYPNIKLLNGRHLASCSLSLPKTRYMPSMCSLLSRAHGWLCINQPVTWNNEKSDVLQAALRTEMLKGAEPGEGVRRGGCVLGCQLQPLAVTWKCLFGVIMDLDILRNWKCRHLCAASWLLNVGAWFNYFITLRKPNRTSVGQIWPATCFSFLFLVMVDFNLKHGTNSQNTWAPGFTLIFIIQLEYIPVFIISRKIHRPSTEDTEFII